MIISTGKVIGTVSIGLMAGVSMTDLVVTHGHNDKRVITNKLLTPLSISAIASLISVYCVSPVTSKHPYLLYASIASSWPLVGLFTSKEPQAQERGEDSTTTTTTDKEIDLEQSYDKIDSPTSSSVPGDNDSSCCSDRGSPCVSITKSVLSTFAFLVCTIGIYGDWSA